MKLKPKNKEKNIVILSNKLTLMTSKAFLII